MGQSFDPVDLRRVFGTFLTGVTVVTMRDPDGTPRGMTANSFTSVSLDPALVLVCIGQHSSNYAAFAATEAFAINVLGEGQHDVAKVFSARGIDRFAAIEHHATVTGSPILSNSLSWFDCTLHHRMVAGDHLVMIGEIQDFSGGAASPLGYSRGRFVGARDVMVVESA